MPPPRTERYDPITEWHAMKKNHDEMVEITKNHLNSLWLKHAENSVLITSSLCFGTQVQCFPENDPWTPDISTLTSSISNIENALRKIAHAENESQETKFVLNKNHVRMFIESEMSEELCASDFGALFHYSKTVMYTLKNPDVIVDHALNLSHLNKKLKTSSNNDKFCMSKFIVLGLLVVDLDDIIESDLQLTISKVRHVYKQVRSLFALHLEQAIYIENNKVKDAFENLKQINNTIAADEISASPETRQRLDRHCKKSKLL